MTKNVLDCGAGGDYPPLSLFYQYGYKTYGVEIEEQPLSKAKMFCTENRMPLNIFRGDMRRIPFGDESFSFVYSFNAIFFMTKPDIATAMGEIERVLKRGGLCYVNFTSVDDPDNRPFCETAPIRHLLKSEGFSKYEDDEADTYFGRMEIIRREKRVIDKVHGSGRLNQAYVEYIARKR
jgi:ubiquinone/menaquinone biosynthesis C-methylase UbiE